MDLELTELTERAHARLREACDDRSWRTDPEDPSRPETVQAMQIVLNLPKAQPPARTKVLEAAAQAAVAVCLDPRAGEDGAFAQALAQWYGYRIRKVARRARNKAWDDVQALPGVTMGGIARAFAPSAVSDVHPSIAKLQIGGTDLEADNPGAPLADAPVIYVDASLGMSAGKAAAQVGHASMLLAARREWAWVRAWAEAGFPLSVREVEHAEFAAAAARADAVTVIDAGFTEVAPNSATVVALDRP